MRKRNRLGRNLWNWVGGRARSAVSQTRSWIDSKKQNAPADDDDILDVLLTVAEESGYKSRGLLYVPGSYEVFLPTEEYLRKQHSGVLAITQENLRDQFVEAANESGWEILEEAHITVSAEATMPTGQFLVSMVAAYDSEATSIWVPVWLEREDNTALLQLPKLPAVLGRPNKVVAQSVFTPFGATVAYCGSNDLTGTKVNHKPYPAFVRLASHKTPHLVRFKTIAFLRGNQGAFERWKAICFFFRARPRRYCG